MNAWRTIVKTSAGAAALVAMGCVRTGGGQPRDEQPQVQQQSQAVDQPAPYVVVQEAPPAPIVEVQPVAPEPDYVWIGGYWNWDNQKYSWQAGRYARPPQADVAWVAPSYDSNAHRYTPGQWSKPNQAPRQNQVQDQKQNQDQQQNQNNDRGREGK
jgi:YXWGXW repeat-containing protein